MHFILNILKNKKNRFVKSELPLALSLPRGLKDSFTRRQVQNSLKHTYWKWEEKIILYILIYLLIYSIYLSNGPLTVTPHYPAKIPKISS